MVGSELYTRHGLVYEKGTWKAANYGRGTLLPINTKVRVDHVTSTDVALTVVESGRVLTLSNYFKYSGGGVDELVERTLSPEPVELSDSRFQADIEAGRLRLGMTKEEAIRARGYPPVHRTPTTDLNRWVYQQNRFATQTIVFEDGKLVEGRGVE